MEWAVLGLALGLDRLAERFERLILWGSGEGVVTGVCQHLPRGHDPVDRIFGRLALLASAVTRQGLAHLACSLAALAGVGFVDDDGKSAAAMRVSDLLVDERELLDRGYDDLLADLDGLPQVSRVVGMSDC